MTPLKSNHSAPAWALLPLRLFLGITFIYAGVQKLDNPQYFNASAPGYIGKQIAGFAAASPLHNFLLHVAAPHALFFGLLVACGEIAIGVGVLAGLLLRPAAFFGLLLNTILFLSASWRVYPYFYGADIVFVFCWLTLLLNGPLNTGLPTVDEFLALNLLAPSSTQQQQGSAGIIDFILGTTIHPLEEPVSPVDSPPLSAKGTQQRNAQQRTAQLRRQNAAQRVREMRRSFLQGTLLGGGVVFGLGAVILAYRAFFFSSDTSTSTQSQNSSNSGDTGNSSSGTGGSTTPAPAGTQGSSSSSAIAQ